MRILFLGMQSPFSLPPFRALLSRGFPPQALIAPAAPGMGPAFRSIRFPAPRLSDALEVERSTVNLYQLAAAHAVPIYEVGRMKDPAALAFLRDARPDYLVAACFPRLLPSSWLEIPAFGCLNLHPSLLPAYRGPTPLEDQLAAGETETGVTLHFMDETADSGDIVSQVRVPIDRQTTLDTLNRRTAEAGAMLLIEALQGPHPLARRPQEPQPPTGR